MNEGELLFTEILGCDRLSLYLNKNSALGRDESVVVSSVLKRRLSGEPLQYILGKIEFMGLEFKVSPDVFIPRPETEILVETVLNIVSPLTRPFVCPLRILDVGTGSGCIAISLAKLLKGTEMTAVDISQEALDIAKQNALLNNVEINFLQSDLFNTQDLRPNTYDLIISNPPYIPTEDIENLQLQIQYEPVIALDGGKDGLDFYRWIIKNSPKYFKKGGYLIMEMGFNQRDAIEDIFYNSRDFKIKEVVKDYNNIDRIIVARKTSTNG